MDDDSTPAPALACAALFPDGTPCGDTVPGAEAFLLSLGHYDANIPRPLCVLHRTLGRAWNILLQRAFRLTLPSPEPCPPSPDASPPALPRRRAGRPLASSEAQLWQRMAVWVQQHRRIPSCADYGTMRELPPYSTMAHRYRGIPGILVEGVARGLWSETMVQEYHLAQQHERRRAAREGLARPPCLETFWETVTAWAQTHEGAAPVYTDFARNDGMPPRHQVYIYCGTMARFLAAGALRGLWVAPRHQAHAVLPGLERLWGLVRLWCGQHPGQIPTPTLLRQRGSGLPSPHTFQSQYGVLWTDFWRDGVAAGLWATAQVPPLEADLAASRREHLARDAARRLAAKQARRQKRGQA